jgi:hypothetical protein
MIAKTIVLNFRGRTSAAALEMAAATLQAGGFDAAEANKPKPVEIGDKMPDGTVYAGLSPETGKPMYVTPADASLTMKWKEAMDYAKRLDTHGHQDWRLPTKGELNVLFNNRAAIGGFNVPARVPRAGTGPLPSTAGGMRGASSSATGFSTTAIRSTIAPAVCPVVAFGAESLIVQYLTLNRVTPPLMRSVSRLFFDANPSGDAAPATLYPHFPRSPPHFPPAAGVCAMRSLNHHHARCELGRAPAISN